jgi:hypothetical protein
MQITYDTLAEELKSQKQKATNRKGKLQVDATQPSVSCVSRCISLMKKFGWGGNNASIALEPDLIMFDEPFIGQDPITTACW